MNESTARQAVNINDAALLTGCDLTYKVHCRIDLGANGMECVWPGTAWYDRLFRKTFNETQYISINLGHPTNDWARAGYTEYIYDGGAGATIWLKKIGSETYPNCDDPPDYAGYDFWYTSGDTENAITAGFIGTNYIVDTTKYDALTISHDGTGSPTAVNVTVQSNRITFAFVGGTYDGVSCAIPVHDYTSKVVQCINGIGRGLSAVEVTNDLLGDEPLQTPNNNCHPLEVATQDLVSLPLTVEYTKPNTQQRWTSRLSVYSDTGQLQSQVDNYTPDGPYVFAPVPEAFAGALWYSDLHDICKCYDNTVNSGLYCLNSQTWTLQNGNLPSECVDEYPGGSNCIVQDGTVAVTVAPEL